MSSYCDARHTIIRQNEWFVGFREVSPSETNLPIVNLVSCAFFSKLEGNNNNGL